MRAYGFDHLDDAELLRLLTRLVAEGRENTAKTVAVIAEVDRRRLFVPAGYTSMKAYCMEALRLSEDAAFKRIQVARAIGEFPALLEMLADGRLHLTGACLLAPHLTAENIAELLAGAIYATKAEIQFMLGTRVPKQDLQTTSAISSQLAPAQVEGPGSDVRSPILASSNGQLAPAQLARVETNLAPRRIPLNLLPETHDKIRRARELLGHELPSGDDALVVDRAMREMVERAEKRMLRAARSRQTRPASSSTNPRHVQKRVKRAVWERDGGQCTFVGNTGHRCGTRKYLEFDHIEPVAQGGSSSVENLRLRCRAHNQYEAEQTFGAGFMARKREAVRHSTAACRGGTVASDGDDAQEDQETRDILNGLRELGFRAGESRRAADFSSTIPHATLEQRMRTALSYLRPKVRPHAAGALSTTTSSQDQTGVHWSAQ
jgi:5-methylcytosine-specific restriction endonuclease McrA